MSKFNISMSMARALGVMMVFLFAIPAMGGFSHNNLSMGEEEMSRQEATDNKVYSSVESVAEFPGGQAALVKWIGENLRYPASAQENGISGRVIVKFIVEKDGSISTPSIIKGVDRDLDKEALRLVKSMPKWQPGKMNGQVVRSYFNIPITFRLQN